MAHALVRCRHWRVLSHPPLLPAGCLLSIHHHHPHHTHLAGRLWPRRHIAESSTHRCHHRSTARSLQMLLRQHRV